MAIARRKSGRIAERIVANELEARGFRVSHLDKDGIAPNVDLVAISGGRPLQIQVKGANNKPTERWWVTHGYCNEQIVIDRKARMFNRHKHAFYKADVVILVAVRSPKEYRCFVLPVDVAERAVQLHLNAGWRRKKWKRGPIHLKLDRTKRDQKNNKLDKERKLVLAYEDGWARLLPRAKATAK